MMRSHVLAGLISVMIALGSSLAHAAVQPKDPGQERPDAPSAARSKVKVAGKTDKPVAPQKEYKEGELLVKFRPGTTEERRKNLHKKHGAEKLKDFAPIRINHLKLKKGMSVTEAMKLYQADPDVQYAEPNFVYQLQAQPNDPRYGELWGLQNTGQNGALAGADIEAPAAWDITTGSTGVVVAVIDSGVDYTHPDLQANMWVNSLEIAGNGIDDDGNGYIDDVHGINAITGTGNPFDDNGHGTHVAGTIGAAGDNATGVAGVNWNVKMVACKFLAADGGGYTDDAVECLLYLKQLKDRGIPLVASNNSWGGGAYSQALLDAIENQAGTLFVASAGNDHMDADGIPSYPAAYPSANVVSVAATGSDDELAGFSNFGRRSVHVAAPGVGILSTVPATNHWNIAGGYGTLSGTSMAAPHVTGALALLKAADSARDPRTLRNLVLSGGDPLPSLDGKTVTGRRLNAYGSLTCTDRRVLSALQFPADPVPGTPAVISALSISCGSPVGGVAATTSGGETIPLNDDGVAPDTAAGDGIFTGYWTPVRSTERLTFSSEAGSDTVFLPAASIAHYVPTANLGLAYRQRLKASGTTAPVVWSVTKGPLPPGLLFDAATGEIAGTPTETGIWPVQVMLNDALGQSVSRVVNLHVDDSPLVEQWAAVKRTAVDEAGYAIAADASGNTYVVSTMDDLPTTSLLLIKYDPFGNELWSYRYDRPGRDWGLAVTVNDAGEVYVAGSLADTSYLVLKLNPAGELLWEKAHPAGRYSAFANAIALGPDGTIHIAGYADPEHVQVMTAKLTPQGDELWRRIFDSPIDAWANDVAVDASGNVYVAGTQGGMPAYDYNYLLMKYDPSGELLWVKIEDHGTKQDQWEGLALDAAGNPHVSGHRIGMMVTRKYDSSGRMIWSADYDAWGTPNGYDIAVDGGGRVYVAGFKNYYNSDFHILCYSPDGNVLLSRKSDSGGLPNDWSVMSASESAFALALGAAGQIYATGYSWNGTDFDMLTIEYGMSPLGVRGESALPPALALMPYSHTLSANGVSPFAWAVMAGSLPPGLTLDPVTGEIRGRPTADGTFTFMVRVTDAWGRSAAKGVTLRVENLSAGFQASHSFFNYAPLVVTFADTTAGAPATWTWDFGDGTSSSERHPLHTYTGAGIYSVSLTASNHLGASTATMVDYITVQACSYAPTRIQADGVPPLEFDGPQAAYEQAQDSAQIMFHAADFSGDLNLERDIRVKFKGGYDCFFSNNLQSAGVLLGKLAVKNGTVALENVRFK